MQDLQWIPFCFSNNFTNSTITTELMSLHDQSVYDIACHVCMSYKQVFICYSPARLKNIDRSTANHTVVTVGEVTVIITEYQPKPASAASGSASSVHVQSSSYNDSRSGDGSDTDSS